jgi:hypothetical protein
MTIPVLSGCLTPSGSQPGPSRKRIPVRDQPTGGILGIVCLLLLALPASSNDVVIGDVSFSEEISVGTQRLTLSGLGLLKHRLLFRAYAGGLYLPGGLSATDALADAPKALELHYFWAIEGSRFGDAANAMLERSHPPERIAALRARLDRLHTLYRNVEAGDRYRLAYVPGRGTTLSYNGSELGTIPGADFASAYFGIWLGENPISPDFKAQLFDDLR